MKSIGLIGGMSLVSTLEHYKFINQIVQERNGDLSSADILLHSLDFVSIKTLQENGEWDKIGELLANSARKLEKASAACILICTNTMHKIAPAIEASVSIPLLHIADATAAAIKARNISKVALFGTRYTMEEPFLRERLERNGLIVIIPNNEERTSIHNIIYGELVKNVFKDDSRATYITIMRALQQRGAEAMVLACTEIPMLVKPEHTDIPLFDPTYLHAQAAVEFAMAPCTLDSSESAEQELPLTTRRLIEVFGGETTQGWGSSTFTGKLSNTLEATAKKVYRTSTTNLFEGCGDSMWKGWKLMAKFSGPVESISEQLMKHDDFQFTLRADCLINAHDHPDVAATALNNAFSCPYINEIVVYGTGDGEAMQGMLIIAAQNEQYVILTSMND